MNMCSAQLCSVSFGITSKSSLRFHLPLSLFLNGPAAGHPFSPLRGHFGTTGQDKLANHVRRKLLSGLGGTFWEWLSASETWNWKWAFPFSCPYQWGLSLGTFPAARTHAPRPAIFRITARWLLKSMDTRGAARSPSMGGLWCSAVKIPAHKESGLPVHPQPCPHRFLQALLKANQNFSFSHTTQAALA